MDDGWWLCRSQQPDRHLHRRSQQCLGSQQYATPASMAASARSALLSNASPTATGFQKSTAFLSSGRASVVDQAGNVWIVGDGPSYLTEIVGAGVPMYQPAAGLPMAASRPSPNQYCFTRKAPGDLPGAFSLASDCTVSRELAYCSARLKTRSMPSTTAPGRFLAAAAESLA